MIWGHRLANRKFAGATYTLCMRPDPLQKRFAGLACQEKVHNALQAKNMQGHTFVRMRPDPLQNGMQQPSAHNMPRKNLSCFDTRNIIVL